MKVKNMYGYLKSENVLDEIYKVDDLFDLEKEEKKIRSKLNQITQPSTLGLIGKYGIGKSTILWQLEKKADEEKETWFVFDAWKYPERKHLWKNFIIDLAKHLSGSALQKAVNARLENKDFKKEVGKKLFKDLKIFPDSLGYLLDYFTGGKQSLDHYFEILNDIVENYPKDLFIVLEDIDRSGDNGRFFLETLKFFLFNHQYEKKVVFIAPIATHTYTDVKCKESYIKSLNYTLEYNPEFKDFSNFIDSIIDDKLLVDHNGKKRLEEFLRYLCKLNSLSIRDLKLFLRNANLRYIELKDLEPQISWEAVICIECMKSEKINNSNHYLDVKKQKQIGSQTLYAAYLYSMSRGTNTIIGRNKGKESINYPSSPIKILDMEEPCDDKHPGRPYISTENNIIIVNTYFI